MCVSEHRNHIITGTAISPLVKYRPIRNQYHHPSKTQGIYIPAVYVSHDNQLTYPTFGMFCVYLSLATFVSGLWIAKL